LSADEQRQAALDRVGKMSIQGVQKKLSAQLKVKEESFVIVNQKGRYIY
jgi:serine/threonine-protein kinase HipA